jgi:hypothetical protein
MNTAISARQLTCLLQDTAAGLPADLAAIELIARHNYFLHRPEFRRIIAAGSSVFTTQPAAVIRWNAAICALEAGRLPCPNSAEAVLRIAASIGDDNIPVHLRHHLGNLDQHNINLITTAIAHANSVDVPPLVAANSLAASPTQGKPPAPPSAEPTTTR